MRKITACLFVMILVSTAGCSGIQIFGSDQTTATPDPGANQQPSDGKQTSTPELHSPENTNVDDVIIRLSDLEEDYDFSGETTQTLGNSTQLANKGIVTQNERTFILANQDQVGEKPIAIFSVAIIYESPAQAEQALQDHLSTYEEANTEQIDVAGTEGWQTRFTTEDGLQNIAVLGRDKNIVYYVVTSGTNRHHQKFTQELFVQMTLDVD